MVGLHGLIVLNLKRDQHGLIAPLGNFRPDTMRCNSEAVIQTSLLRYLTDTQPDALSFQFHKLELLPPSFSQTAAGLLGVFDCLRGLKNALFLLFEVKLQNKAFIK